MNNIVKNIEKLRYELNCNNIIKHFRKKNIIKSICDCDEIEYFNIYC